MPDCRALNLTVVYSNGAIRLLSNAIRLYGGTPLTMVAVPAVSSVSHPPRLAQGDRHLLVGVHRRRRVVHEAIAHQGGLVLSASISTARLLESASPESRFLPVFPFRKRLYRRCAPFRRHSQGFRGVDAMASGARCGLPHGRSKLSLCPPRPGPLRAEVQFPAPAAVRGWRFPVSRRRCSAVRFPMRLRWG